MVKESVRKCSHCGHNGHNSRTCNGKGCLNSLKLFGVTILADKEGGCIRKSKSMGNLMIACHREHSDLDAGYLSDGLIQSESHKDAHDRKKGVPWTKDEHLSFLSGLDRLGKGDWRGIAKNYVPSRTPTQVASHAQKYYLRLTSTDKKKRRSSLFDMSFKELGTHHSPPLEPPDQTVEISQQVDTSPAAANLNSPGHTQVQLSTSSRVGSPLDTPPVLSLSSSYGVPDLRQMPYMPMVGVPSNWQTFPGAEVIPTVSFVPVINFPNHGYFCLP